MRTDRLRLTGLINSIPEVLLIYALSFAVCVAAVDVFEKWPTTDALWFGLVTVTTTGYGDLTPHSVGGRAAAVALMIISWVLNIILAIVFIVVGIVAFIHPGDTFRALAAVFSFFLIFAGTFDIIISISTRHEIEVWWLQLVGGIIELALGFWAAGYYGRSAVLLIAWVAAFAVIRGVRDIVLAFRVREVQHAAPA